MSQGLVDTNVVILHRDVDPESLPEEPLISAVTLAELALGPLVAVDDLERARRQEHIQKAESELEVVVFDTDCARAFATVAADVRRTDRKVSARAFDSLIAATALAKGLPLYTANPRDFEGISDLEVHEVTIRHENSL